MESIADAVTLAPVEQLMIRHQFGQVEYASEQWFRLAASTLASSTHVAGIATAAKPPSCRVRRVDLVAGGPRLANLVLVLAEGAIKQALMAADPVPDQEDLEPLSRKPSTGASWAAPRRAWRASSAACRQRCHRRTRCWSRPSERTVRQMRDFDASAVEDVFSEGLLNVMEAPEFARSEKLRRVFSVLQDRGYLGDLLPDLVRDGGVRVFIGSENAHRDA